MERHDYREEMRTDILSYIFEEIDGLNDMTAEELEQFTDRDYIYERFYDDMFISDSITGNASGSYTFSTWKAEENLCHNLDLVEQAFYDFGLKAESGAFEPEYLDVTVRCYMLSDVLFDVADEIATECEERLEALELNA